MTRLVEDLQPEGSLEVFYVHEIARSMWRVRRASVAEKGSALSDSSSAYRHMELQAALNDLNVGLKIVKSAQEEIGASGTLSPRAYATVVGLMELESPDSVSEKRLQEISSIGGTDKETVIAQEIDAFYGAATSHE